MTALEWVKSRSHFSFNNNVIGRKLFNVSVANYWFMPRPWCRSSTALLALFSLSLYPCSWSTWRLISVLVFYNRGHAHWEAVYFRVISLITLPYRFPFSLHFPTRIVPFNTSSLFSAHTSMDSGFFALHGGKFSSVIGYFCLAYSY